MDKDEDIHWYALKVFFNRVAIVQQEIHSAGCETYYAKKEEETFLGGELIRKSKPLVPSLLFVRCTLSFLVKYKQSRGSLFMYYQDLASGRPCKIPDKEMEQFIAITSMQDPGMEYLGEDAPHYHVGDRVRVTGDVYKGMEGIIKRIKRDRRLIVTVSGVAVFATSFIHPSLLQKI